MKSRGPSTEPRGTPCDKGAVEEVQLLILMNCCLSVRVHKNGSPLLLHDSLSRNFKIYIDVLIPSVVPHLDAGVGGGDDVEMFNGGISSKSPSFVSKLRLITTKTIISTLVSSLLLNSNHPGWGS